MTKFYLAKCLYAPISENSQQQHNLFIIKSILLKLVILQERIFYRFNHFIFHFATNCD